MFSEPKSSTKIFSKESFYTELRGQTDEFLEKTHYKGDRAVFYQSILDSAQQEKKTEIAMRGDTKDNGVDKTMHDVIDKI